MQVFVGLSPKLLACSSRWLHSDNKLLPAWWRARRGCPGSWKGRGACGCGPEPRPSDEEAWWCLPGRDGGRGRRGLDWQEADQRTQACREGTKGQGQAGRTSGGTLSQEGCQERGREQFLLAVVCRHMQIFADICRYVQIYEWFQVGYRPLELAKVNDNYAT